MRTFSSFLVRPTLVLALGALPALAQAPQQSFELSTLRWPVTAGIAAIQMRPEGAFRDNIGFGYGVEGGAGVGIDPWGILRLRATGGAIWYGHESKNVPLSATVGGRITVKLVTTNMTYFGSVGPELGVPVGPVRPYVHSGVGYLYFITDSHVEDIDDDDDESHFSTKNFSDGTRTRAEGAGVRFLLNGRGTPVMLDVSANRFRGGNARYLKPGSIRDLPDGSIEIVPMESETRFINWRVGLTIGR